MLRCRLRFRLIDRINRFIIEIETTLYFNFIKNLKMNFVQAKLTKMIESGNRIKPNNL
jgi:hypothetical protein